MTAPTDRQILELAGRDYRYGGSREQAIRTELDLSAVTFWARVVAIIAEPDPDLAREYAPLIARLRRRLEAGRRQRTSVRAAL